MVVGKPYVHWKINTPVSTYENVDINYLWATIVEASKGPINTPILCASNQDVLNVFGIDLGAYFAQGAAYLVVVRASAASELNPIQKSEASIKLQEPFEYEQVIHEYYTGVDEYDFISYADQEKTIEYAQGTAKTTGVFDNGFLEVEVISNESDNPNIQEMVNSFVGKKFFIQADAQPDGTAYQLYEGPGSSATGVWVAIVSGQRINRGLKKVLASDITKFVNIDESSPNQYKECDGTTGKIKADSQIYTADQVVNYKSTKTISIEAGTELIHLEALFDGDYDLKLNMIHNIIYDGYNITLSEGEVSYMRVNNIKDLEEIVNRINTSSVNVRATLTPEGQEVANIIKTNAVISQPPYSDVAVGQILAKDEPYDFVLEEYPEGFAFVRGANGEWNYASGRINANYQVQAHKNALESLKPLRIAGIFCLYGESKIQREYLLHGTNPEDEYNSMNSNVVCKWRYILIGANEYDRSSYQNLIAKPKSIDDQYVLFLGQGLVDGRDLAPYECTPYIAGLRAKLNYGESIFGGQARKEIKGLNTNFKIRPLFSYENELIWEPRIYSDLNEHGVLTFTEEYGLLTLTDGVTTIQNNIGISEEGVMNIVKYVQHGVQNLCVRYIGRNMNVDLESALEMSINSFLSSMQTNDQTLVDRPSENLNAYEVDVTMGATSSQLVGTIYVNLKITPVHALRAIEIGMTIQ